ncbi:MAG: radical SAM protein [Chloroflexi bacterium]|jgi:putative pyruvate formate lyase activating enzyme|nr:radical SAM protein [Chloroflexota bacterium]
MLPSYLETYRRGALDERLFRLYQILQSCELCPRRCHKNRLDGEERFCQMGEEDPLVGRGRLLGVGGSGTILLTGCNLGCAYCQNYDISHLKRGSPVSPEELSGGMIELQRLGCHNINFVTPTHFVPQLVKALKFAIEEGLNIPIVYNCGGYENVTTIKLLEGIVDIYMPDMKYSDARTVKLYSNAPDYFDRCCEAVKEMHRQVGDLKLDDAGIAQMGVLTRHLILPNDTAGSHEVFKFIAEESSKDAFVNIMFQYRPLFRAFEYQDINRRSSLEEYRRAIEMAVDFGLHRGFEVNQRIDTNTDL